MSPSKWQYLAIVGYMMQNPLTQYPKLNIPKQQQDEPGLDSSLVPHADHGFATYHGSGRLKGRKALITGGDSGIGAAVAFAFAAEGAQVTISYLPVEQSDADAVKAEIEQRLRGKIHLVPGDLISEKFSNALVDEANKRMGGLDVVVNNAGRQIACDNLTELPTEQLAKTFQVNFFSMVWVTKRALKYLKPGATIINTASVQAYTPSPTLVDYAASKAASVSFTKSMALQLAPSGIRVNAVAPGPVWTPLQPSYGQPMEKLIKFGQDTPLQRAGQPAEIAPAYVFLASQEASFITGEVIGATGGKLLP